MATKFERIYVDMENEFKEIQENFDYDCISKAFGHSILKMVFGLSDDEAYDCNTDGSDDNGIDAIYFEAIPHTSLNAREKVISLTKELLKYTTNINLYVVPITKLQESIYKNIDSTYMITILRRMMYRIAEKIALKSNCLVLINGESIGQVASQTLSSINVINRVVNIPIIRPVACFDKLEIIDIAKRINTYKTSILPYEDCCTIFVPKHPVINPNLEKCEYYESLINYDEMIKECIDNTFVITIKDEEEINDLL